VVDHPAAIDRSHPARWSSPTAPARPSQLIFVRLPLFFAAVTADTFQSEMDAALKAFDKFVICLDKTPEDCERSLESLMQKAIKAYENRGQGMRHGIALDNQITIILSQTDSDTPLCGIYFNLHSPYKKGSPRKVKKDT
jgi:hypothetical protein